MIADEVGEIVKMASEPCMRTKKARISRDRKSTPDYWDFGPGTAVFLWRVDFGCQHHHGYGFLTWQDAIDCCRREGLL